MATHGRGLVCLALTRERMRRLGIPLMAVRAERAAAGLRRVDRGATGRVHGHQRGGPRHHDPGRGGARRHLGRPRDAGPRHARSSSSRGGSAGARGVARGGERSRAARRARARGRAVRGARPRRQPRQRRAELEALARAHGSRSSRVTDVIQMRLRSDTLVRRLAEAALPVHGGADVPRHRLRQQHRPAAAHGARAGRAAQRRRGPRAPALGMPHGRRLRLAALRLRRPAGAGARADRRRRAAACWSTCIRRGGASGSPTRSAPTRCRTRAATPSRRTSSSASRRTCATTASARRSCATSASSACGCSPTTPQKIAGLEAYGITVVARAPLEVTPHAGNIEYLRTKQTKLGHLLSGPPAVSRRPSAAPLPGSTPSGDGLRIGIALARFNRAVTDRLLAGALEALAGARRRGRRDRRRERARAPSSCRSCAQRLAMTGRYDALVCLGAVVRGETPHFDFVAGEAASGHRRGRAAARPAGGVRRPHHRHHGAGARARRRRRGQQGLRGGRDRARDGAGCCARCSKF